MKKLGSLLLVMALVMTLVSPASAKDTAKATTLRLTATEGTVTVANQNGRSLTIRDDMKLISGYTITTGASSYAYISLDDDKAIKLDASTTAEIRKSGKKLEVLVSSGKIFFNVTAPLEEDESLEIRTSTIVTGIRGTSGVVDYIDEHTSSLSLLDGTVVMRAVDPDTGETVDVPVQAGQSAVVTTLMLTPNAPGTPPAAPKVAVKTLEVKDVPGFAAAEVAKDPVLQEKITQQSTLDVKSVVETAADTLAQEQKAAAEAQKQAEQAAAAQENKQAAAPFLPTPAPTPTLPPEPPSGGGTPAPTPTPPVTDAPQPTPPVTDTPQPTPPVTDTPQPTPPVTDTPQPTPPVTDTPQPTPPVTDTPQPSPSPTASVPPSPTTTPDPDSVTLSGMVTQTELVSALSGHDVVVLAPDSIVNIGFGTLTVASGKTLDVRSGASVTLSGAVEMQTDGTLLCAGSIISSANWENQGHIKIDGGSIVVNHTFTMSGGTVERISDGAETEPVLDGTGTITFHAGLFRSDSNPDVIPEERFGSVGSGVIAMRGVQGGPDAYAYVLGCGLGGLITAVESTPTTITISTPAQAVNPVNVGGGQDITLRLTESGSLTLKAPINNVGSLTLTADSAEQAVTITNNDAAIVNSGTLIVSAKVSNGTPNSCVIENSGILTLTEGGAVSGAMGIRQNNGAAVLEMTGGKIDGTIFGIEIVQGSASISGGAVQAMAENGWAISGVFSLSGKDTVIRAKNAQVCDHIPDGYEAVKLSEGGWWKLSPVSKNGG